MAAKQLKLELAKSIISRSLKRPNQRPPRVKSKKKKIVNVRHDRRDSGYTVDLSDLLFTPNRHFLVRNNGQKVRVDDLKGKSVVLYIVPIYEMCLNQAETLDMIQAYEELSPFGGIEFVFVPACIRCINQAVHDYSLPNSEFASQEAYFDYLFSTIPFPAVPFCDVEACGGRVVETFSVDDSDVCWRDIPHWVIVDRTGTVVATRAMFHDLFKLFGGAELYPLSLQRIHTLLHDFNGDRRESRKRLIGKWDQLLASRTRDFLLSSNGDRVPISSLKGKVIGLYFCENIPCPPRMDVIREAYREAKLRGYDFEIVQINFHYEFFNAINADPAVFSEQQRYENINWLTLPFKDPSCRKLQRIFQCEKEYRCRVWDRDCLVIVHPHLQGDDDDVLFEFSGAEVIDQYGIEAFPFTRQSIYETAYRKLMEEVKLQTLFPPGLCQFTRDGSDLVNDSQLKGKRVLVLFGDSRQMVAGQEHCPLVSILKSEYRKQAEEGDEFEVVYVSTDNSEISFSECIKDMPWLVHPYSLDFGKWCSSKVFVLNEYGVLAIAFDMDGKLVAKGTFSMYSMPDRMEHQFPFISQGWKGLIQKEVKLMCHLDRYYVNDEE